MSGQINRRGILRGMLGAVAALVSSRVASGLGDWQSGVAAEAPEGCVWAVADGPLRLLKLTNTGRFESNFADWPLTLVDSFAGMLRSSMVFMYQGEDGTWFATAVHRGAAVVHDSIVIADLPGGAVIGELRYGTIDADAENGERVLVRLWPGVRELAMGFRAFTAEVRGVGKTWSTAGSVAKIGRSA